MKHVCHGLTVTPQQGSPTTVEGVTNGPVDNPHFTNHSVSLASLPRVDLGDFQPLERRLLQARIVGILAFGLALLAGAVIVTLVLDDRRWIGFVAIGVVVAITMVSLIATRLSFRYWGYLVREHDLTVCHGVIRRTVTSVSFNRVQHAAVNSGPIERWLGLATLRVYTAGGVGADVNIEGLSEAGAATLQQLILANVARAGQSTARLER